MKKPDVSKHALVPKHTKLSEKEKEEVLKVYSATLDDFPRILKKDAAIQGLNVKAGDVVKVTRNSSTAGEITFYRTVVSS
jgi:DNA-directed RNA polymerase subunit H